MDVTKAPPPGTPPSRSTAASSAETGSQAPATPAPAIQADRANIRPLDVPAALQILLAEIRASFELTALNIGTEANASMDANGSMDNPPQSARAIVQVFLQALPEQDGEDAPAWLAAVSRAEATLQAGLDRGIAAISAWRNVPAMVVDAARETQQWVLGALGEETQNPAWLRPEWAGFAPSLERFRRRRRLARRRLIDPDYVERNADDSDAK